MYAKTMEKYSGHCVATVWPLCGHCVATVWAMVWSWRGRWASHVHSMYAAAGQMKTSMCHQCGQHGRAMRCNVSLPTKVNPTRAKRKKCFGVTSVVMLVMMIAKHYVHFRDDVHHLGEAGSARHSSS